LNQYARIRHAGRRPGRHAYGLGSQVHGFWHCIRRTMLCQCRNA